MALVLYTGQAPSLVDSSELHRQDNSKLNNLNGSQPQFVGLSNQGATCYLNSLIQTLYMTPEFRKAIFSWRYDAEKYGAEEFCIPLQLQRLFGLLTLGKMKAVDTVALTKSFGWEGSEVFQQQDVQELTRVLFDALEETFKGTSLDNIIDEIYAGELIDYIRCIDVDYQSERNDKFLDLSFAIIPFGQTKAMKSLSECIEMFLRPELLDGDNKYYAESFDRKVDAIKGLKFSKLPQIMSCNLKRFVYDFSGGYVCQKKLNDIVTFPIILDMNRYVFRKKRLVANKPSTTILKSNTDCDDCSESSLNICLSAESESGTLAVTSDSVYEPNLEFEEFLLQQMNQLRQQNQKSQSSEKSESNTTTASTTTSPSEPCKELETFPDAEDSPDDLPDLVDLEGNKSPDQIEEERAVDALKMEWSEEELENMILTRGEWIYELFAVLIHSGAISGGHYYAYIKNIEDKKWYNFNDSSVIPINVEEVRTAWGSSRSYYTNSNHSYYGTALYGSNNNGGSSSSTVLNSANAYMLMYRKVSVQTVKKNRNLPLFPSVSTIPQYIIDEIKIIEEKQIAKQRELEEAKNRVELKVYWKNEERSVKINRFVTYHEFLLQLWNQFELTNEPDFELDLPPIEIDSQPISHSLNGASQNFVVSNTPSDSTDLFRSNLKTSKVEDDLFKEQCAMISLSQTRTRSGISTAADSACVSNEITKQWPPLHRTRVRIFYNYNQSVADTYEYEKYCSVLIDTMGFGPHRSLLLETRGEHDIFEYYYENGINVNIDIYDPILNEILPNSKIIRIPSTCTCLELYQKASKMLSKPINQFVLIKCVIHGYYDVKPEALECNSDLRVRDHYQISDYSKVILDPCSYPEDLGSYNCLQSPAIISYKDSKASILLKYNSYPSKVTCSTLAADYRWTVGDLRKKLAELCNLTYENTRILKGSFTSSDLRDDSKSLATEGFFNNYVVCVLHGKVMPAGFHNISLSLFTPKIYRSKAHVFNVPEVSNAPVGPSSPSPTNSESPISQPDTNIIIDGNPFLIDESVRTKNLDESDRLGPTVSPPDLAVDKPLSHEIIEPNSVHYPDFDCNVTYKDSIGEKNVDYERLRVCQDKSDSALASSNDLNNISRPRANSMDNNADFDNDTCCPTPSDKSHVSDFQHDSFESMQTIEAIDSLSNFNYGNYTSLGDYQHGIYDSVAAIETIDVQSENSDIAEDQAQNQNVCENETFDNMSAIEAIAVQPIDDGTGQVLDDLNFEEASKLPPEIPALFWEDHQASKLSRGSDDPWESIDDGMWNKKQTSASRSSPVTAVPYNRAMVISSESVIEEIMASDGPDLKQRGTALSAVTGECTVANHIEPNDFAERKTSTPSDVSCFSPIAGLESVAAADDSLVRYVKEDIVKTLIQKGYLESDRTYQHIRLRDKTYYKPEKILRDDWSFKQQNVRLYDSKELCIQVLDEPEDLGPEDIGDILIIVQRWHRNTCHLDEGKEVYLKGSMTVRHVAYALSELYQIKVENLRALTVYSHNEVRTRYLNDHFPKGCSEPWFNPSRENLQLKVLRRLNNSDLLLIQDISEPDYLLTPSDALSIQLVDLAECRLHPQVFSNYDDNYGGMYSNSNSLESSTVKTSSYSLPSQAAPYNGIKIKIHRSTSTNSNSNNQSQTDQSANILNTGAEDSLNSINSSTVCKEGPLSTPTVIHALFTDL